VSSALLSSLLSTDQTWSFPSLKNTSKSTCLTCCSAVLFWCCFPVGNTEVNYITIGSRLFSHADAAFQDNSLLDMYAININFVAAFFSLHMHWCCGETTLITTGFLIPQ
jgi:hypothetical protein